MGVIAEAVKHLIAAGVSGDELLTAISAMEETYLPKRTPAALRQERYRERKASQNRNKASQSVTTVTKRHTEPSPTPLDGVSLLSPHTPHITLPLNLPTPPREAKKNFSLPGEIPLQDWKDFCEMRQKIRKPMSDRAKELISAELIKFKKDGHDPGLVLQQSIKNGWQGVFKIKDYNQKIQKPTMKNVMQL